MTDEYIVDLYLSRDEAAIRETQTKYGTRLNRIAETIVRDAGTAGECENDTYLKTWEMIPPHEPRTYFFPFLAKIVRNLSLDVLRREQAAKRDPGVLLELTRELEEVVSGPTSDTQVEDAAMGRELEQCINRFLGTLLAEDRKLFVRRYWYGMSIRDLARATGSSESKVKTRLFRTRKQLKDTLEKEGYQV